MEALERLVRVLFTRDGDGRLVEVNEDNGPRAPRLYVAWSGGEVIWRTRHDVAPTTTAAIAAIVRAGHAELMRAPTWMAAVRAVLAPITDEDGGIEYEFPPEIAGDAVAISADNADVLDRWLPSWRPDARLGLPMTAVIVDGAAVSVCACVRRPDGATQAGLETHASFRGRGFAPTVTAAWARAVRARGLVPLYGTSWTNHASQRVAAKLGLRAYAGSLSVR